jgi:hypothetical protein
MKETLRLVAPLGGVNFAFPLPPSSSFMLPLLLTTYLYMATRNGSDAPVDTETRGIAFDVERKTWSTVADENRKHQMSEFQ